MLWEGNSALPSYLPSPGPARGWRYICRCWMYILYLPGPTDCSITPSCLIFSQSNLEHRWCFLCNYRDLTKQDTTIAQRGFFRCLCFKAEVNNYCHSVPIQIPEQYTKALHHMFLPAVLWVHRSRMLCISLTCMVVLPCWAAKLCYKHSLLPLL